MKYDIVIVGAGIIGLATAYKLRKLKKNVIVIDKEKHFGIHTSSRNSQVIHSGIYYPKNSKKAIHCINGNSLIYDFCEKNQIPYKKTGKIIVAQNQNELIELRKLYKNGLNNGLKGLKILSKKDLSRFEPNLVANYGLFVPSTGILDVHKLMSRLEFKSSSEGVDFLYNYEVSKIIKNNKEIEVVFSNGEKIVCSYLVNSCGLWSDKIGNMTSEKKYKLMYFKGDYYSSSKHKKIFSHLIYPLPTKTSLGIHAVLDLEGNISFGPNSYQVYEINYSNDNSFKNEFFKSVNQYLPIDYNDLNLDFSGIRPKVFSKNQNFKDFIIDYNDNCVNLVGIESPGITSSLSIANQIKDYFLNLPL